MNCEFCQSPVHIWFQCPKKPDGWKPARLAVKSTAARKDVQTKAKGGSFVHKGETQSNGNSVAQSGERPPTGGRSGVQIPPTAGTQALPVDTNPESSMETLDSSIRGTPFTPSAGTGEDKDRQPKFDKKAWQREYMREYMRKRRAAK